MKRFVAIFIVILIAIPCFASFQIGIDCRDVDSAFYKSMRLDAEFSWRLEELRFTIPLRYGMSYSKELYYLESGINISLYPLKDLGLFLGASLFKGGYFFGLLSPEDNFNLSSEAFVGWTFSFPYFYVEPRLTYYDLFASSSSNSYVLKDTIRQFSSFRFSLYMGVEFL